MMSSNVFVLACLLGMAAVILARPAEQEDDGKAISQIDAPQVEGTIKKFNSKNY